MNKQLYFVFGFLSAVLLASMFASVSAIGWREIFGVETGQDAAVQGDGDVQLGPMPARSCGSSDTRTRTLEACQWVKSPLGEFTNLRATQFYTHGIEANRSSFDNVITNDLSVRGGAYIDATLQVSEDLEVSNSVTFYRLQNRSSQPLGTNYYLCIDIAGNVFKSRTPCV